MFREISVSEYPVDLTEAINMAVIESLPSTEFLSQVKFLIGKFLFAANVYSNFYEKYSLFFIYRRPTLYPLEIAVDFLKSL
jgi:hypothetical protein